MKNKESIDMKVIIRSLMAAMMIMLWPGIVTAIPLTLADKPMYLGNTAKPNLVFVMDDSGSMGWDYIPDEVPDNNTCKTGSSCSAGDPPYYAAPYNKAFYNPEYTYTPGLDVYGNLMTAQNATNTSTWTAVDRDPYRGTATDNLITGFRDKVYYPLTLIATGTQTISKSGDFATMTIAGHGLVNGDRIRVSDGNNCSSRYRVSNAVVSNVTTNTFRYNTGTWKTSSSKDCKVEKVDYAAPKRNGIDTTHPFEYRDAPTGETGLDHGYPTTTAPNYVSANYNTNGFYYTIIPMEYCSDATLVTCVASTVPTGANTYPAYVRFCDSTANADADAPVTGGACQKKYTSTYKYPRYGKFYRKDIVSTTASYVNLFVNSAGTVLESANATETGYTKVLDRANRTDCAARPTCTYAEEMTNFANWYSYYRLRTNAMKTAAGRAFAELSGGENIRVGYAKLKEGSVNIDGVTSNGAMVLGVRPFTGAAKAKWFTEFYGTAASGGTPLRETLDYVGQYYSRGDNRGPWASNPEMTSPTELTSAQATCRQSYALLSSDGYWNGNSASTSAARANVDSTDGPVIGTWANTAVSPFRDIYGAASGSSNYSNTLADVAMYYWKRDLRNIANDVPTTTKDPAFWQHMVTFTLGFGLNGVLDPATDLPALTAGTKNWPNGSSNQIDDMWHAAVNGRGTFFSASDPQALSDSLTAVFADIADRTSSAASVAIDTAVTQTSRAIYQARFYSGNWTGTLKEFPIDLNTGVLGAEVWDAQTQVNAQDWDSGRFIATWDPAGSAGSKFRWADLTAAQKTLLNATDSRGSDRVDYVRGKTTLSGFRSRSAGVLGDIVHSSPRYVGGPNKSYTSSSYTAYKTGAAATRTPMIYVGANDGMLHAFNASNGTEAFAFVPNALLGQFENFSSPAYVHKYFVDGPITVEDVQISSTWKTVLVGALGGGGKSVYALDITNPTLAGATPADKEADLASKVLWEFTDTDLGYVHGEVAVAQMANGAWAAIFGNGYNNSGSGEAALYIVNIADGTLIKKIKVGGGATVINGMAAPLPVDVSGNGIVDYIYAGDLEGNVWKFDVTSAGTGSWASSFVQSGVPKPLFVATDGTNRQPITSRVDVGRHPSGSGYMVYFGTGKYLENADNSATGQNTQTFYGIWDKNTSTVPTFNRTHLLPQTIDYQFAATTTLRAARVTSDTPMVWHYTSGNPTGSPISDYLGWYMDLKNPNTSANEGERVVTNPSLIAGRIIFATFLPPADVCAGGGDSWLMELDAKDGSRLGDSVWDVNKDTSVDASDFYDVNGDGSLMLQVSGAGSSVGAVASPTIVNLPGGQRQIKILSGSSGQVETIHEAPGDVARGRQSWIRLQ